LRRYIVEDEPDARLRTVCLLLLEIEIERLKRLEYAHRLPG
jgi:hypothetical protein